MAKPEIADYSVAGVIARWREQYPENRRLFRGEETGLILKQLEALPADATPEQINTIIGNDSWTRDGECSGCGKESGRLVRVGHEPDYESKTAYLCEACLREALELLCRS